MRILRLLFIAGAYVLASPLLIIWVMVRMARYMRILARSVSPSVTCVNCRNEVSLVGVWQCGCGFAYSGHVLLPCPVCSRVPRVVRCLHCRVTTRLT
jgi:hypothetical protein